MSVNIELVLSTSPSIPVKSQRTE